MADSAPCNCCCGTGGTGWLNGDHPSVHDGIVERQVKYKFTKWYFKCLIFKNITLTIYVAF